MKTRLPLALSMAAVAALAAPAFADTIRVPEDHDTIQGAVDAAADDDVIVVGAGTYRENVTVADRVRLTIRADGAATLEGQGASPALTISADQTVVEGLTITSGGDGALVTGGWGVSFYGCTVKDCAGDGIRYSTAEEPVVDLPAHPENRELFYIGMVHRIVENCVIRDCGGHGLAIEGASLVEGYLVEIAGVGGDGIHIASGSGCDFASCTVTDAGWRGIAAEDHPALRVWNCSVSGTGAEGVYVARADDVLVWETLVEGAAGDGIVTEDCTELDAWANVVQGGGTDGSKAKVGKGPGRDGTAAPDGLVVRRCVGLVESNSVRDVLGTGIRISATPGALVYLNSVEHSGGDGLVVGDGSAACDIRGNDIDGAGGAGVVADGADHVVGSNIVWSAGEDGIVADGSGMVISDNAVVRAARDGIVVLGDASSAPSLVAGNRVDRAGDDGIEVQQSTGTEVSSNEITSSRGNGIELRDAKAAVVGGNRVSGSRRYDIFAAGDATGARFEGNVWRRVQQRIRRAMRGL